ncbi:MAG: O-antigen ligase family protein [Clostridiales Family XIII bacterium]|jgi:hypothetical protein|nr:O-antigen ligase family protein [Clostridiales Family XIII bacterium]
MAKKKYKKEKKNVEDLSIKSKKQQGKAPTKKPQKESGKKANSEKQGKKNRPEKQEVLSAEDRKKWYLLHMRAAPRLGAESHFLQLFPIMLFTAIVILIVRQYRYEREMTDFFWYSGKNDLIEFFSHYKVVLIEICAALVLVLLLYRVLKKSFSIKRSLLYIPMLVYIGFVMLSFVFSKYKLFAWVGWNDRFEGTLVILCYMLLLFYIINTVGSERDLKWILYPIAGMIVILSFIGISQATGHDFFQSTFGQKLITPRIDTLPDGTQVNSWAAIDSAAAKNEKYLRFAFEKNEIYQTVYNINYVSFYLTLLLPLFGLVFIREQQWIKKTIWGVIFALLVFNLIGSASSGGLMGCFVIVVMALIVLHKRLLLWWKSIAILMAIVLVTSLGSLLIAKETGGILWTDELTNTVRSVLNIQAKGAEPAAETASASDALNDLTHKVDYFSTKGNELTISLSGNVMTLGLTKEGQVSRCVDASGKELSVTRSSNGAIVIDDNRFFDLSITPSKTEAGKPLYLVMVSGETEQWPFAFTEENEDRLEFYNLATNKTVSLEDIPHWGFANNQGFGSGRGYIWSTTFPMLMKTIFIGHGADTYSIYFPHDDYVGKYKADWSIYKIVDKPHNMYLGIATGPGVLSLLAFLTMMGMYIVQSFRLYRKEEFTELSAIVGLGVFLGVCGFLVSAFVNDSSVSVMPLFYGLLGTGIACNMMLKRKRAQNGN